MPRIYKKKPYKKYIKKYSKRTLLSKNVSNSMRLARFKIQGYLSLVSLAAAAQFDYKNSYPLNFPGYYTNNSGTYGPILNGAGPLFASAISNALVRLMNTFDTYKVMSLRVDWVPFADRVYTATTQDNSAAFASSLSYTKDLDDVALLADNQIALNNAQKPLTLNRKATMTYRQPSITRNQWFNCQNYTSLPGDAPFQGNVMPENAYKSLKIWASNIPTSATVNDYIGRIYLTWDVMFKGINSSLTAA